MNALAKYGMMFCVVVLAALGSGRTDSWHLLWAATATILPIAGYGVYRWALASRRRETPARDDDGGVSGFGDPTLLSGERAADAELSLEGDEISIPQSLVLGGLTGAGFGLLLWLYLLIAFTGLQQIPWVYDAYYDGDRVNLEATLTTLEQAGNYDKAAAAIEDRLTRKSSADWRQTLQARLYGNLIQRAGRLTAAEKLPLLDKTRKLAAECQLDDAAARTLLEQARREVKLVARIDELRRQDQWPAVVEILKSELMRDENSVAAAKTLYDACCAAASQSNSQDQQIVFYSQAVELAERYELQDSQAQTALRQICSAQEASRQHAQQLSELRQFSTATRRTLLEEMLQGAEELPSLRTRLDAMRRIDNAANEFSVALPELARRIAELDKTMARQLELEGRIAELRQGQKSDDLITLLAAEVRKGDRKNWIRPFDSELLALLRSWCDGATGAASSAIANRCERLQQAVQIATECGLDARDLKYCLASVESNAANCERIRLRINELTASRRFDELAAYLKVRIEDSPEAEWAFPYGQELYTATIAAALASDDLNHRATLLREAIATASKYRLESSDEAESRLTATEQKMRERAEEERLRVTPIDVPAGLRVGIAKISSDSWPFVICDFWAETENGEPLMRLQPKDFTVTLGERTAPFVMQPVTVDAVPGRFVILVDFSGSAGPVVPDVKRGVAELALNLAAAKAQMRLITFNAEVNATQSWTTDPAMIAGVVQGFKAEGGTALYRALLSAAEELGRQPAPGDRHILLFTDGKDSAGGVSLDDVLQQLKANEIAVSAVALKSNDLDPKVLQRLTVETGGEYLEAANAGELGARFAEAARSIHRHRYRLVLDAAGTHGPDLESANKIAVKVGRGRGAVATEPLKRF